MLYKKIWLDKEGLINLHGVINVLKHAGVSSHDIVANVRKLLKTKKVGHTGTLDPDAVGVLVLCIGKATKLVEYLTNTNKTYRAELCFGYETDTQDGSGQIIKKTKLPEIDEQEFINILKNFLGEIEQIPPMFSAIKKNGQPLYKLARQGKVVEVEPRKIKIHKIDLLKFDKQRALIEVTCGKGTYIRTLCQDIGRALGSSAYMSFLLRTQSGNFHINNAYTLAELAQLSPDQFLIKPADSLIDWPGIQLTDSRLINRVKNGNKIPSELLLAAPEFLKKYKVLDGQGDLLAIGEVENNFFKPIKVFR